MTSLDLTSQTHTITVAAPARAVYDLIADVTRWPYVFSPTVHVERQPLAGNEERLHLWAFANGEVRDWTSRRTLDPEALNVRFQQEISSPPVERMGGEWRLESLPDGSTKVELLHSFKTIGDNPRDIEWVRQATDRNSGTELGALRDAVEQGERFDELTLSFTDSVLVDADAGPVYDFLYRVDLWPRRLPHVGRLEVTETGTGIQPVQSMEMDTTATDGSVHTTKSVRVCFPQSRTIVYKQTATPELMAAHTGRWTVSAHESGTKACSQHTVVIRPERIAALLGEAATLEQARQAIRRALGTNSMTTLEHAKAAAERDAS